MRQRVNGDFLCAKDKTSANCQETASPSNFAPAAFNMNQNSTLCLPLISKEHKIIWVHSDQINIQLDKVTELDNAFSRFPYLTQRQTASLAQRCSLHPDQVKVWFMAQRLCYGISWDSKDIHRVRRKMLGQSRSQEKLHKSVCKQGTMKKTKRTREVKDNGEGGAASEKGANQKVQPKDREKGIHVDAIEDTLNPKKKQKRSTEMIEEKRTTRSFDARVEGEAKWSEIVRPKKGTETVIRKRQSLTNSEGLLGSGSKPDNTPNVPQESQTCCPPVTADGSSIKKRKRVRNNYRVTSRMNWRVRTPNQLEMMKLAFVKYQYPNTEQYQQLSLLTGFSRYSLRQWFNKTRYFIKNGKPGWMSAEQHSRAVANVVNMQYLQTLEKTQDREKRAEETRKMKSCF